MYKTKKDGFKMIVSANNGNFPVNNTEELKAALNAACGEIWLGEDTDSYPCIAVLCCEGGASLNYFVSSGGDMYVSVGNKSARGSIDVNVDGEAYTIECRTIIPESKILECAAEFMNDMKLPACIGWEKL